MSFGASSGPDPIKMAEKQSQAQQELLQKQTVANRPDQQNAWGDTSQWTENQDGSWSQSTSFGGGRQQVADAQLAQQQSRMGAAAGLGGAMQDQLNAPFQNYSGQEGADAFYAQGAKRLDSRYGNMQSDLEASLAAKGLDPGSEAYGRAQTELGDQRNDAYDSLANQATMYGQDYAQEQIQTDQANRLQALNLMNAASAGQGVQDPSFQSFAQAGVADAPDYMGATQLAQQQAQQQNQLWGDVLGGAAQLGGAAMMFSDDRLKANVRYTGRSLGGVPQATWNWLDGSPGVGVLASDVEKTLPGLVKMSPLGYKMVDYGRLACR